MAKFVDVANEFAKRFIHAEDKRYALNQIVYDMNYLVFSDTKQPLNYHAKCAIFKHIFNIVAGREELTGKDGEMVKPEFTDIVYFFERRSALLKHLQIGLKKQSELN
jgi:hypothetical protein